MSKNVDILLLGWPDGERDHHITIPVLVHLQKKFGLSVKCGNIFNGYGLINSIKPKLIMIASFSGAKINHEVIKYAYLKGIKIVSLISEGNILSNTAKYYLWGHNKDEKLYVDLLLLWSERSRNIIVSEYPQYSDMIKVSGGTGFDRFVNCDFKKKEDFLRENNLTHFKKVIGIASWGFDLVGDNEYFESVKERVYLRFSPEQIEMHREDLYKIQKIYKEMVLSNPDTLFILRYHPASFDFVFHEFYGLEKLDNVYISKINEDKDYSVSDLISISDLWIAYQSTTTIEAWLMKKPTLLVNPTRSDFVREEGYLGSAIYQNYEDLQKSLDEFYESGEISAFNEALGHREKAIEDSIGRGDGKNYQRAAKEIYELFNTELKRTDSVDNYVDKKLYAKYLIANLFPIKKLEKMKNRSVKSYFDLYDHLADS